MHLLNHALGLISLQAMESGRWLFITVWRNPLGSALLFGAMLVHLGLAFWAIDGALARGKRATAAGFSFRGAGHHVV